jgi:hypothetical protein
MDYWGKDEGALKYPCGYCGAIVGVSHVLKDKSSAVSRFLAFCAACDRPTFFDNGRPFPGAKYGEAVGHLPAEIAELYDEARECMSIAAFTSAVLACRKLLMNVAVAHGAKPGQSFVRYVEHLVAKGFVPPTGKDWVDHIRTKGNEATHEITPMTEGDARTLIDFTGVLLKLVFEFPNRAPKSVSKP